TPCRRSDAPALRPTCVKCESLTCSTGPVLDLYRGGRDESTFGPVLQVSDSHFTQVGRNAGASLRLHGV
ncbi:hypothetical protein XarbCFBP8150_21575, partial [Xanthomonas arboricola]